MSRGMNGVKEMPCKQTILEGSVYTNRFGNSYSVKTYVSYAKILVEFSEPHKHTVWSAGKEVIKGACKSPYDKRLIGRGYIGEGKYTPKGHKSIYRVWKDMIERCYIRKRKTEAYIDCNVYDSWFNFQEFAEWCENQKGFGMKDWQLDKDLLVKGNKVYGPNTCAFVPSKINTILHTKESCRGDYPVGVTYLKKTGKFMSSINNTYMGNYATYQEAHQRWQLEKARIIRETVMWWSEDNSVNKTFNKSIAANLLYVADKLDCDRLSRVITEGL